MTETGQTIFHKIIRKEIPATIVHEDEKCIAFRDVRPAAPTHILVVPRKTLPSMREATAEDAPLIGHLLVVAKELAKNEGLADSGYRIVINAGDNGGQTVYQLHVHLLGGRPMSWPPG